MAALQQQEHLRKKDRRISAALASARLSRIHRKGEGSRAENGAARQD
jgi:hypothetical protein